MIVEQLERFTKRKFVEMEEKINLLEKELTQAKKDIEYFRSNYVKIFTPEEKEKEVIKMFIEQFDKLQTE